MYTNKNLFSYATDFCMVFPKGLEKHFSAGNGEIVIEDDYIIFFKSSTPTDIKKRFIEEYAEYHKKELEKRKNGVYN